MFALLYYCISNCTMQLAKQRKKTKNSELTENNFLWHCHCKSSRFTHEQFWWWIPTKIHLPESIDRCQSIWHLHMLADIRCELQIIVHTVYIAVIIRCGRNLTGWTWGHVHSSNAGSWEEKILQMTKCMGMSLQKDNTNYTRTFLRTKTKLQVQLILHYYYKYATVTCTLQLYNFN